MSKLIENIKRLAAMIKGETKSGGNTAARVGGLFEEIATELEEKYDKSESDEQALKHNTNTEAHKNIQERIDTALNDLNQVKLNKTGDGRDVAVSFNEAAERKNVSSGEKLSVLWGKVCRWFTDLQAVAFSGKAADLEEDQTHRFVSDTEKTAWNSKAAGTHTHGASEVIEETNKRFLTDAERTKIASTYGKSETYTRGEIDTKDNAILDTAKKYVMDRISDVISGSPAALDTLYEIANALNNDPAFATTIMALINGKADTAHKHTKSQITDFPTSMPASDVYEWAKQPNKPAYTAAEIGAAPSGHNHDTVYQPVGNYATANHGHSASAITEEADKLFMTSAERSKLSGIDKIFLDYSANYEDIELFLADNKGNVITQVNLPAAGTDAGLLTGKLQYISGAKMFEEHATFLNGHSDSSDIRKKKNLEKIENTEEIIQALTGYKFTYTDSGKKSLGIIAQDLQKVLPQIVHEDRNGFLSVEYSPLIAVLIEDNKKIRATISELKRDMESIKKTLL